MRGLPKGFSLPEGAVVKGVNLAALGVRLESVPQSEEPASSACQPPRGDGSGQTRKYGNHKVRVDGHWFDSRHEAERYQYLKLLASGGQITDLELQPTYAMVVNGDLITTYRPDFRYRIPGQERPVVEDAKSEATKQKEGYRLRRKLLKALYGIEVSEV